jgi:endonuclease YncB( thermonuclease family)
MTEKPVSHEQISAQIKAIDGRFTSLENRLDRHEKHSQDISEKIFEKADKALDAAHSNSLQLATVQATFSSIMESRVDHVTRLGKAEAAIASMQNANSKHDGERSVLVGFARSPVVMALIGAIGGAILAVLAAVKNVSAHIPMVMLAMLVTAALAHAAIAKPVTVVSVHVGDTLTIKGQWAVMDGRKVAFRVPGGVNIRLLGIDTPELGARAQCPAENALADRARDNLRGLVAANGGVVEITAARHDKYGGRLLASPRVKAGSLADAQIAGGFAAAYSGEGPKRDWCNEAVQ